MSYCPNPFRYVWNDRDETLARRRNPITRAFLRGAFRRWRQWDWIAARQTDRHVANSRATQARIRAYFGREASVVYPPVETRRFSPGSVGDHRAVVAELMPHKQIDVAIDAFNKLRLPLIVVGDGPETRRLRRIARPTVHLSGRVRDARVAQILQIARALIVSVEEFGIASVESKAAGRPVIARRGGGALETIIEGSTGCLWGQKDREAVLQFDDAAIDPTACTRNAARFDVESLKAGILAEVLAASTSDARATNGLREPLASTRIVRRELRTARRGGGSAAV